MKDAEPGAYERPAIRDHGSLTELTQGEALMEVARFAQFSIGFASTVIANPNPPRTDPLPPDIPIVPPGGGGGGGGLAPPVDQFQPTTPGGGGAGGAGVGASDRAPGLLSTVADSVSLTGSEESGAGTAGGSAGTGGGSTGGGAGGGSLPFTGYALGLVAGAGLVLAGAGKALRRIARR